MDFKLDMYNPLDTLESFKKGFEAYPTFLRIYDVINVGFFVILQFLDTASVKKFAETLDFHIEYVFW